MGDDEVVEWASAALTYSRAELAGMVTEIGLAQTVGLVPPSWLDPKLGADVRREWDGFAHGQVRFGPHLKQVLLGP